MEAWQAELVVRSTLIDAESVGPPVPSVSTDAVATEAQVGPGRQSRRAGAGNCTATAAVLTSTTKEPLMPMPALNGALGRVTES